MGYMGEGKTYTTIRAVVTHAAAPIYGIAVGVQIFEAADPQLVAPLVGDVVLADYLPSSGQWLILAVV